MKRLVKVFIALSLFNLPGFGQNDSVSLFECFEAARNHAALKPQLLTMSEITDLRIASSKVTNLPQLNAYGKAWYQSDAMSVSLNGITAFEIDPFQYNLGLEADQKLFDGGLSKKNIDLETVNLEAETERIEAEIYQINNQVVQYFFGSILYTRNLEVVRLKEEILYKRINELQSAFDNGAISRNELDKLNSEVMTNRQQIIEIEKLRLQALNGLKMLTGFELGPEVILIVPDSLLEIKTSIRPEYRYFDAESRRLQSMVSLKTLQNMPKLYAYGQLGYSYPGLNYFENQSDYYYMVGAKLSWTIFDWRQVSREKQMIRKQQEIVVTKQTDFERKTNQLIDNEKIEQEKLRELILLDKKIIVQRNSIATGSASALQNGMITSAVYLEDLNNEIRARIEMESHKIQFMNSIVRMYLLYGIDTNNSQIETE